MRLLFLIRVLSRFISIRTGLSALALLISAAPGRADEPGPAERLRSFVEAPARLVWLQQVDGDGDDPFCWGDRLVIMGLDTEDGRGKRRVVDEVAHYHRPMLSPDGRQVVFSSLQTREAFVADWDEGKPRWIGEGYAAAVWRDPGTDITWVYLADIGHEGWDRHHASALHRIRIDDPSVRELVWDRAAFTIDNVQLSADGTRFCSQFIHPRAGYADIPNRSWTFITRGCWTSMAPDNSYLVWIFDGPHRNVTIHDPMADTSWRVPINTAPGMDGLEVYHPRWSNHRDFFTITGPYKEGRRGDNLIPAGGPAVEVLIGRFADDLHSVEDWVQITDNPYGNFYPDLWIDYDRTAIEAATPAVAALHPDDPFPEGLYLLWKDANASNDADNRRWDAESYGRAFWGPFAEMELDGGYFEIIGSGEPVESPDMPTAFTLEAIVRPADVVTSVATPILVHAGEDQTYWALEQVRDRLHLRSIASDTEQEWTILMGAVQPDQSTHILLTYDRGDMRAWRDGEQWSTWHLPQDLTLPRAHTLWAGRNPHAAHVPTWRGRIESVALYDRALSDAEAKARQAWGRERLADREEPPEFTVTARLNEALDPPDPNDILPYRRALQTQAYTVEAAPPESGLSPGDEIAVSHWTILNEQVVERDFVSGESYDLHISPFDKRPLLESERLFQDADFILLPHFYESRS